MPYYEDRIGLRPFFIRLKNQLVYSLYKESTSTVIIGKNGQLLEKSYHQAFMGPPLEPKDSIHHRIKSMAQAIDSLKARGKTVLTVIGPNKVDVFREYIPDEYTSLPKDSTAYQYVLRYLNKYKVDYLDFNKSFRENRDSAPYPLISNTGVHWSGYGNHVAQEEIRSWLKAKSNIDLAGPMVKSWQLTNQHATCESDLANLMSLLFPIETEPLAKAEYALRDTLRPRIKALIIGDSFFHNYYSFPELLWRSYDIDSKFWRYNKTQIDMSFNGTPVSELSAHQTTEEMDFIIFMATAYNMDTFPFGFPEKYLNEVRKNNLNQLEAR